MPALTSCVTASGGFEARRRAPRTSTTGLACTSTTGPSSRDDGHVEDGAEDEHARAWSELWHTARGQPVEVIEERLERIQHPVLKGHPQTELHIALTARVMSDRRWLYAHPRAAVELAWQHRHTQSPLRTLNWLRRPRFGG